MAKSLPQPHWANANRVTDFLMVGGSLRSGHADPATVLRELASHGLTHILDCRSEQSDAALVARHAPEIAYHNAGTDEDADGTAHGWFDSGVGFAREALATNPNAVVLTHCALGQTRGPSMGFAVLLDRGVEPGEAFRMITTARPQAGVGYAHAALHWHLDRTAADERVRAAAVASLDAARHARHGQRRGRFWRPAH